MSARVVQIGTDTDPDRQRRIEWGSSLEEHLAAARMTRKQLQHAMAERGVEVSLQAISYWITGSKSPRERHQAVIAGVLNVPVRRLFPIEAA